MSLMFLARLFEVFGPNDDRRAAGRRDDLDPP